MRMNRRVVTIEAESGDPLLRAVREAQLRLEFSIESLRLMRASLGNVAANLLEHRQARLVSGREAN
jgi:hypothetical protein